MSYMLSKYEPLSIRKCRAGCPVTHCDQIPLIGSLSQGGAHCGAAGDDDHLKLQVFNLDLHRVWVITLFVLLSRKSASVASPCRKFGAVKEICHANLPKCQYYPK